MSDIEEGEVQVWCARPALVASDAMLARCWAVLNAEERVRAERMRAGTPRQEQIVARGMLRILIGAAIGHPAEGLAFRTEEKGKPYLVGEEIFFSVSHSRGYILIALSRAGEVGVDVERIGPVEEIDIAGQYFHPAEYAFIASFAEPEARRLAFFGCWTLKEAVVKADGRGLSVPLKDFSVASYVSQRVAATSGSAEDEVCVSTGNGQTFFAQVLTLEAGFAAALATTRAGLRIRRLDFPDFRAAPIQTV